MGINDNVKKEEPPKIKKMPQMFVVRIEYLTDRGIKRVHYSHDGIMKYYESPITHRDEELLNKNEKMDTIRKNLSSVDLNYYEQVFNCFTSERNAIIKGNSNTKNEDIENLRHDLIVKILTDAKKLYTVTSNTCLKVCSCELRKYLNSNLPNYCHLPISTQIIANFNSSF